MMIVVEYCEALSYANIKAKRLSSAIYTLNFTFANDKVVFQTYKSSFPKWKTTQYLYGTGKLRFPSIISFN